MPGEIVGEVFFGLFKIIGRIFSEAIFELLIKGAGYLICKPFNSNVNADGAWVVVMGFIFWGIIIFLGISTYDLFVIDKCLDSGGRFDYETNKCVH